MLRFLLFQLFSLDLLASGAIQPKQRTSITGNFSFFMEYADPTLELVTRSKSQDYNSFNNVDLVSTLFERATGMQPSYTVSPDDRNEDHIKRFPDKSFTYEGQHYGPDCRPLPTDNLSGNYPVFENCTEYMKYDIRWDVIVEAEKQQCQEGNYFKKLLGGCVKKSFEDKVVYPRNCMKRGEDYCDYHFRPIVTTAISSDVILDRTVYLFKEFLYEMDCNPIALNTHIGARIPSMKECTGYFLVDESLTLHRKECRAGKIFNRVTKACEYGIPCIEYPHKCRKTFGKNTK